MSKVLELADKLDGMAEAAEEEADAASHSDEHLACVAEANAFRLVARWLRESAVEDAAEIERLRATLALVREHMAEGPMRRSAAAKARERAGILAALATLDGDASSGNEES